MLHLGMISPQVNAQQSSRIVPVERPLGKLVVKAGHTESTFDPSPCRKTLYDGLEQR